METIPSSASQKSFADKVLHWNVLLPSVVIRYFILLPLSKKELSSGLSVRRQELSSLFRDDSLSFKPVGALDTSFKKAKLITGLIGARFVF